MAWPVLVPETEPILEALVMGLLRVLGFGVAAGICYIAVAFVKALFGGTSKLIGWIPYANKVLAVPLHKIEQKLTSALADDIRTYDRQVSRGLYSLASLRDRTGKALWHTALLVYRLSLESGHAIDHLLRHDATIKQQQRQTKHAAAVAGTAAAAAAAARKAVAHARDTSGPLARAAVRPELASVRAQAAHADSLAGRLEHTVDGVLTPDLAGLRERVKSVERGAIKVFEDGKTAWRVAAVGAVTAAVAVAIGRLGIGWTRCNNWRRLGRGVCGLPPSAISDLLGLLTDVLIVTEICSLLPLLETAFTDVAGPLIGTVAKAGAGLCDSSYAGSPLLSPPALSLPAVAGVSTLYLA